MTPIKLCKSHAAARHKLLGAGAARPLSARTSTTSRWPVHARASVAIGPPGPDGLDALGRSAAAARVPPTRIQIDGASLENGRVPTCRLM